MDSETDRALRIAAFLADVGYAPNLLEHVLLTNGELDEINWAGVVLDESKAQTGSTLLLDELKVLAQRVSRQQADCPDPVQKPKSLKPGGPLGGSRFLPSGRSAEIKKVVDQIQRVGPFNATALILGESGTGKERVAHSIHDHSNRSEEVFVPLNCGAIPADLMESELFGHEKGAFTGALNARKGRFELAEGGTLFLDEIGDMSLDMQVKLLRVLQEQQFERVGGSRTISCDVRIVAATHRDLKQMVADGRFRADLYYRLSVFPIDVPALRNRKRDLPLLIDELIRHNDRRGGGSISFTKHAIAVLGKYDWPGNIRELANLIERLAILKTSGVVDVVDLPPEYRSGIGNESAPIAVDTDVGFDESVALESDNVDLKLYLQQVEVQLIERALQRSGGVVAEAARHLKVGRTTLVEKIRKYDLIPLTSQVA